MTNLYDIILKYVNFVKEIANLYNNLHVSTTTLFISRYDKKHWQEREVC
jgi:hypothetical protein